MATPKPIALPPQSALLRMFSYERETGRLMWNERPTTDFKTKKRAAEHTAKMWNSKNAGKYAFQQTVRGYKRGKIDRKLYLAHRVVWKMHHGTEPNEIDHINGVRDDNRIENLRATDKSGNQRNAGIRTDNTSGRTGVFWYPKYNRWLVKIGSRKNGIRHVGYYDTFGDAKDAREQAEREMNYYKNDRRGT